MKNEIHSKRREFLGKGAKIAGAVGAMSLMTDFAFGTERANLTPKSANPNQITRKANGVNYIKVGNTDIEISQICIGAMSFGKAGTLHDWTLDEKQSEAIIKHALEKGINFWLNPT